MGMYDTIYFKCPKCGKELNAQSKSGECILGVHNHIEVPIQVAYDANRHAPYDCDCGKSWYFDTTIIPKQTLKINLPIIESPNMEDK